MNIMITGFSGFIGRNFIKMSSDLNIQGIDLLLQKVEEIDFNNIDTVLHLAALVHQMDYAPEGQYFRINRDLSYEVAKQAKDNGVKQFVFMSTVKVYGESTSEKNYFNENSECNPVDPYGKSKLEAEFLIKSLEDENFKVAILRSPLVYGAEVKANMLSLMKLINSFRILPLGGIRNERSLVYVGNLVALINAIIIQKASGIFIAGDRKPLSTSTLIRLISDAFGKKLYLFKLPDFIINIINKFIPTYTNRIFDSLVIDNNYTNRKLNFYPPFSSEEGISEMVKWYVHHKVK